MISPTPGAASDNLDALLASLLGKIGTELKCSVMTGLVIDVILRDAHKVFGRVDILVEPVAGSGREWVRLGRVSGL